MAKIKKEIVSINSIKTKYYDDNTITTEKTLTEGTQKIITKEVETDKNLKKNANDRLIVKQENITETKYNDNSSIIKTKEYLFSVVDDKIIKELNKETTRTVKISIVNI